jgi:succinate dehydrogenase (ubiquinone) cytochrome b560 subunit
MRQSILRRRAHTQAEVEHELLVKQRRARPIAPHLSIYKPQITWYLSMFHRITGFVVSGTFYAYFLTYLLGPYAGIHVETLGLKEKIANMNSYVKTAIKAFFAGNFAFHSINGFRHLTWDTGAMFTNAAVIRSGWIAVVLSAVATGYLTWL